MLDAYYMRVLFECVMLLVQYAYIYICSIGYAWLVTIWTHKEIFTCVFMNILSNMFDHIWARMQWFLLALRVITDEMSWSDVRGWGVGGGGTIEAQRQQEANKTSAASHTEQQLAPPAGKQPSPQDNNRSSKQSIISVTDIYQQLTLAVCSSGLSVMPTSGIARCSGCTMNIK